MKPGATINGTLVKDDDKVVAVINAAGLTSPVAGKIYQIVGDVTLAEPGVTIPADVTVLVPDDATLTGTLTGAGSLTVEGTGKAPGMPKLTEGKVSTPATDANPEGLELLSATKNLGTGDIAIKLGGTVADTISSVTSSNHDKLWNVPGDKKPAGKYSWVTLDGIITEKTSDANTVIKNTNEAFRYYEGAAGLLTTELTATPTSSNVGGLYIDANKAYNWRYYGALDSWFAVLLWSEAKSKTARIEITQTTGTPSVATSYTVAIDWSGVNFK
jgi:hypothetical protein